MSRRKRTLRAAETSGRRGYAVTPSEQFDSSPIRRTLVIFVAVKVVGAVLLFDPASALAFDGLKASFSLTLSLLLGGLLVVALLRFGFRTLVRTWLHVAVAAFALANILATFFAQDQYTALFGAQRRLGLTFVADMLVLYLSVAVAFRAVRDWAILGVAVAGAGAVAIGYGLVQYLGLDPIPWVDEVRTRPPSTFGNPDKFGHFLGATCVAALAVAILPVRGQSVRIRVLAGLYAMASLVLVSLVATRGALVGVAVALPVLGAVYLHLSRRQGDSRLIRIAAGATLVLVLIGGAGLVATPLGERMRTGLADAAAQQRAFLAQAAIRAFGDRPLTGHGPDNFGVVYPRYRSDAASPFVGQDSAHSWLLQALVTTGIAGALSLAAVALVSLILLWRATTAQTAVPAALLVGAVAYWANGLVAIGSVSVDWMGWVTAGSAAAMGQRVGIAPARRVSLFLEAAILGLAVVIAGWGYPAFQANRELYAARTTGSPDRAVRAAERAVSLDAGRAEYWFALGKAREARGATAEAARAYRAAVERAPYVTGYWGTLALALTNVALAGDQSLGGKEAALAAARRAVEADPSSPTPHNLLAVVANALGDPTSALEAAAVAIRLHQGEAEYDNVAAGAALRIADASAARLVLERIVLDKDSAVLRVALAQVSLRLQDFAAARVHARRALELDPQNAPARELTRQLGP